MTSREIWQAVESRLRSGEDTFVCNTLRSLTYPRVIPEDAYRHEAARLAAKKPARRLCRNGKGTQRKWYPTDPGYGHEGVWFPITKAGHQSRIKLCQELVKESPDERRP